MFRALISSDQEPLIISHLSSHDMLRCRAVCKSWKAVFSERKYWLNKASSDPYRLHHYVARLQGGIATTKDLMRFCASGCAKIRIFYIDHSFVVMEGWIYDITVHPTCREQHMSSLGTHAVLSTYNIWPVKMTNERLHIFPYFDERHPFPSHMIALVLVAGYRAVITYSVSDRVTSLSMDTLFMRIDDSRMMKVERGEIFGSGVSETIYLPISTPIGHIADLWNFALSGNSVHTNECKTFQPGRCACLKRFRHRIRQSARRKQEKGVVDMNPFSGIYW